MRGHRGHRAAPLITCLAIVEKDLHDAIGAKLARGRVHPVAVVRDWQRAAVLLAARPIMHIGMDEHWTTLTRRRPLVEHGWPSGARVSRYPTAGSHHSYGMDSTTRRFPADVPISLKMVHAPSTPGSVVLLG